MKLHGVFTLVPPMPSPDIPFEIWRDAHWAKRKIYYRTTVKEDENSVLSPDCYQYFVRVHGKPFRVYPPVYLSGFPIDPYFYVALEDAKAWEQANRWGSEAPPKPIKRRRRVLGL